jgi:hypothetical protein
MSAFRLSDINFESFSNVEVGDILEDLIATWVAPVQSLVNVIGGELAGEDDGSFVVTLVNKLEDKVKDLGTTLERLGEQWHNGRVKPERIKKFGKKAEAELEAELEAARKRKPLPTKQMGERRAT